MLRGWTSYAGAALLIVLGAILYSVDADFPTAGTPILALPLVVAGLVWGALALRRQVAPPHGGPRRSSGREDD